MNAKEHPWAQLHLRVDAPGEAQGPGNDTLEPMRIADLPGLNVLVPVALHVANLKLVVIIEVEAGAGNEFADTLATSAINRIDFPERHGPLPSIVDFVLESGSI
jgi:hypothetical protein